MQRGWIHVDGTIEELCLPSSSDEVIPGVRWGALDELFTPSFWKLQSEVQIRRQRYAHHRLGQNFLEEIAVCMLGGYGIPAEMGMLAFRRLKAFGLLSGIASQAEILEALTAPFLVSGTSRHYRFASQKASYLSRSLSTAKDLDTNLPSRELRKHLLLMPGIGPKTASWIVRNYCNADDVAIIDIHLHRACVLINLFDVNDSPQKDYFRLEDLFLLFCFSIGVRASILDAIIWDYMRRIGPTTWNQDVKRRMTQLQLAL